MNKQITLDEMVANKIGAVVDNGHERLLIPASDIEMIDRIATEMDQEEAEERDRAGESPDFDWSSDALIALREQPETAVYFNPNGALVIRQRRWPDDDTFVFIIPNNIGAFVDHLSGVCGFGLDRRSKQRSALREGR